MKSPRTLLAALLFALPSAVAAAQSNSPSPPSPTARTSAVCTSWELATQLVTAPDANPDPDPCGTPVWHFLGTRIFAAPGSPRDPATYLPLNRLNTDVWFVPGLKGWEFPSGSPENCSADYNDCAPEIDWNSTGKDIQPGMGSAPFGLPARRVLVHPAVDGYFVVGWRSPFRGSVTVTVAVAEADPSGSTGVRWHVDLGSRNLASGLIPTGGAPQSWTVRGLGVGAGDMVYVILDPDRDQAFDNTFLDVTVKREP